MQGQGHSLGVDGAQDLGCCSPQQWLPVVQGVVRQLCWVLWSWHSLHLHHLSKKRSRVLPGHLGQALQASEPSEGSPHRVIEAYWALEDPQGQAGDLPYGPSQSLRKLVIPGRRG